jgi:glucose uptake protein GlcU
VTHGSHEVGRTGRTVNQTVALAFGAIYTLVGLAGFFVSETFAGRTDNDLLGFQVNHLHNIVHLLIGVALIAASKRVDTARGANLAIGVTYLALGVLGPLITDTALNVVALNSADHVLHLASGALLTAVALLADKKARTRV